MIREATHEDLDDLIELGRVMHAESPRFRPLSFDDETLRHTLTVVLTSPHGFLWVAEAPDGSLSGCMVAMLQPKHWFGLDATSCDLALFMRPEFRGSLAPIRLVNAYAAWAKNLDAKHVLLGIMTGVSADQTEQLLTRIGWRRAGVVMEI